MRVLTAPWDGGVSARGVDILIKPGAAVLSYQLRAILIALTRDLPQLSVRPNLPIWHLTSWESFHSKPFFHKGGFEAVSGIPASERHPNADMGSICGDGCF